MWRIRRFLKNLYARCALNTFLFNDPVDEELDALFWAAANAKISNLRADGYRLRFTFNGLDVEAWNENRFYAWLTEGCVKRNGQVVFGWERGLRPSPYVMWAFYHNHIKNAPKKKTKIEGILYQAAVEGEEQ